VSPNRSPDPRPTLRLVPSTPIRRLGRPPSHPLERPQVVPFAAAFGLLAAAEDLYVAWLLWDADPGLNAYVLAPLLLAGGSVSGAVLMLRGRRPAWLVSAVAAALLSVMVLALVALFGALGAEREMLTAVLLLLGPLGSLVLSLRRPIRTWTAPGRASRSPGGRRRPAGSR
jgi:hypothetical protein